MESRYRSAAFLVPEPCSLKITGSFRISCMGGFWFKQMKIVLVRRQGKNQIIFTKWQEDALWCVFFFSDETKFQRSVQYFFQDFPAVTLLDIEKGMRMRVVEAPKKSGKKISGRKLWKLRCAVWFQKGHLGLPGRPLSFPVWSLHISGRVQPSGDSSTDFVGADKQWLLKF